MSTEVFDGFTTKDYGGMRRMDFEDSYMCHYLRTKYKLYASLGLHRYNLVEGKNFTLDMVKNYNQTVRPPSIFFITLVASDPSINARQTTFQVEVDEGRRNCADYSVPIARPLSLKKEPVLLPDDQEMYDLYGGALPKWPSEPDFKDDNRFYRLELETRDLEDNGWITLFLELVVCSHHVDATEEDLTKLKIREVVIEASGDAKEKLKAERVILYIKFSGAPESGVDDVHKAIIRRDINKRTGYLSLLGQYWSGNVDGREMRDIKSIHTLQCSPVVDGEKQTKKGNKTTRTNMTCGESSNVPAKQTKKGNKTTRTNMTCGESSNVPAKQTKKGKKRTGTNMTCGESSNVPAKQTKKGKKRTANISS